ncbi:GTP cyclohydrolase II [Candidatus Entotheonella palauensis]|uniref:GTP cyclohydrolase II n=1 Tax=Candidatus Entotheonella palauensis TaxID=93172 RepID=UPI000B7F78C0|nr:GTP cyclohydrolase II [Candidatus Entotheonella palauensis]
MDSNGKAATTGQLIKAVSTRLPTQYGEFTVHAYEEPSTQATHLALVCGDVSEPSSPLVRIHSECMTGDLFGSVRCDCGEQLTHAMQAMQREGAGILIYLRQEGRGIGLMNKLRAYNLQDTGLDTVDANVELGFKADYRNYHAAVEILEDLQVRTIRLLTNNPDKLAGFEGSQVQVLKRVPLHVTPNGENLHYMRTKRDRLGHLLDFQSWTT